MLTVEFVKDLFEYKNGVLIWKNPSKYKRRLIGHAVTGKDGKGYIRVGIKGKRYSVHRVIYFIHYNIWPDYVDHINANKLDNRIENLRSCSNTENSYNAKLSKSNKSGFKGICWSKQRKKWHVQITAGGKRVVSKYFENIKDAKDCVAIERATIHGEFARNL